MSVNKVMILGRLGQDPELKYTPGGQSVCNFSLATSEFWQDKSGQKQERTEWHRIVVWGKMAELCKQYLAKGRQAFVEGKIRTRSWEGQDGKKNYMTEIIASTVQFIGSSQGQSTSPGGAFNQDTHSQDFDQSPMGGSSNQSTSDNNFDEKYNVSSSPSFAADDIPF